MRLSHTTEEIAAYTARQLNLHFPDGTEVAPAHIAHALGDALERVEFCFRHIVHPAFCADGVAQFDLLHSDQYGMFLALLANTVYRRNEDLEIAKKLFYLNKALHAFNCMYDTELPDIFWFIHMVGTVIGKAAYSNYLVVRQNCTIGALGGEYPVIGEGLILSAGASIIGGCRIGSNVMIGPSCTVFKTDVPDNTLVTTSTENRSRPHARRAIELHFQMGG